MGVRWGGVLGRTWENIGDYIEVLVQKGQGPGGLGDIEVVVEIHGRT